jgi:Flp pilus assembly pilin Flp
MRKVTSYQLAAVASVMRIARSGLARLRSLLPVGRARLSDESGESLMEYELLIGFLIIACIATLARLGAQVHAFTNTVTGAL